MAAATSSAADVGRMRWVEDPGSEDAWYPCSPRTTCDAPFGVYRITRTTLAEQFQGFHLWWYPASTPTRAHHLGMFPTQDAAKRAARRHVSEQDAPPPPPVHWPPPPQPGSVREAATPSFQGGASYRREVLDRARQAGPIADPRVAGWVLEPVALREVQEVAIVASLGVHSQLIDVTEIARGAAEHVDISLPMGIRAVAKAGSRWALLAHNHPSGDANPSADDARLWRDARDQFRCAGLTLLDHLILARGEFYSFQWGSRWRLRG